MTFEVLEIDQEKIPPGYKGPFKCNILYCSGKRYMCNIRFVVGNAT